MPVERCFAGDRSAGIEPIAEEPLRLLANMGLVDVIDIDRNAHDLSRAHMDKPMPDAEDDGVDFEQEDFVRLPKGRIPGGPRERLDDEVALRRTVAARQIGFAAEEGKEATHGFMPHRPSALPPGWLGGLLVPLRRVARSRPLVRRCGVRLPDVSAAAARRRVPRCRTFRCPRRTCARRRAKIYPQAVDQLPTWARVGFRLVALVLSRPSNKLACQTLRTAA